MALAGGVTTANIMPGSGNVIGGQTALRQAPRPHRSRRCGILAGRRPGRPQDGQRREPQGLRPQAAGARHAHEARRPAARAVRQGPDYQRKWDAYRKAEGRRQGQATPPERDLALEPLVEVLERKRTVHFHCHRADDLMTAVRLAEEFGFELVLQHGTEGYRVADELAARKVPVSLTLVDSPGGKPEVDGPARGERRHPATRPASRSPSTPTTSSPSRASSCAPAPSPCAAACPRTSALKALTLHGAQMLHLDDRVGSLEKGKDADFVVLSGAPFSVYTQVLETYIDGEQVFDRSEHEDWTYQAGGFALADPDALPEVPAAGQAAAGRASAERPLRGRRQPDGHAEAPGGLAGRIHTVGERDDRPTASSSSRTARSRTSGRAQGCDLPAGDAGADGRRRDARADRRPLGRRPVRRAQHRRPTRTRTRRATPTRPTCACSTASTPTSRCCSSSASRA